MQAVRADACTEDDDAHLAGIRRFLLEPQETYSLDELAALWRTSDENVRAIYCDELARQADSGLDDSHMFRVTRDQALRTSIAYHVFRPVEVEQALGADFGRVFSESWRTVPILIHVPRFVVDALASGEELSFSRQTTSARIERYLLDLFPREREA